SAPQLTNARLDNDGNVDKKKVPPVFVGPQKQKPLEPTDPSTESFDGSAFLQGIVKPKNNAVLRFSNPGIVSKVHVKEGTWVDKGSPLMTTDDRLEKAAVELARLDVEADASLAKAKLELELTQSKLIRLQEAMKRGASTQTEVMEKRHELEAARLNYKEKLENHKRLQVQLEIAKVNLANKTLTAPFKGQIIRVHHKLGNSVDFSTAAVVCADHSILQVEMNLPSSFYGKLKIGESCKLHATAPVQRSVDSIITHISNEIEPSSRTFRVNFEIDNRDLSLPSGFEVWYSRPKMGNAK
ncbi:MAG: efflux RND transporter periplasmic adaptor subunit, partial [Planctomycetota bacterium]